MSDGRSWELKRVRTMANAISYSRIVLSAVLLFLPTFSPAFYLFYILTGLTDMLDGAVARNTGTVSKFGAVLDTVADFVFVLICLFKFLPIISIPFFVYVWIAVIALIRFINIVSGYILQKKFVTVHSFMNKITGAVLFIFPLTISIIDLKYSVIIVCIIATFSAIQEGHFIRTGR